MAMVAIVRLPGFRSKQTVSQPLPRSLKVLRAHACPPKISCRRSRLMTKSTLAMMTAQDYGRGSLA